MERQVEEVCWVTEEAKRAWKVAEEAKNICQELEQVERVQLESVVGRLQRGRHRWQRNGWGS